MRIFKKPETAIRYFLKAYEIEPNLDERWKHARFWFSEALVKARKLDVALQLVDIGLTNRPDDRHLLGQKAKILSKLWRSDENYEDGALAFFRFRIAAIPNDYLSLSELIDLHKKRGRAEEAWSYLEANLDCEPYSLLELKERAQLTLNDFNVGFRHYFMYGHFRSLNNLEEYPVLLRQKGLSPNRKPLKALELLMMIPFGHTFHKLRTTTEVDDMLLAFDTAWIYLKRIFPAFSVDWISTSKPSSTEDKSKLISLAILYVPEVALIEAVRQIGYIMNCFIENQGKDLDKDKLFQSESLQRIRLDMMDSLLDNVFKDWNIQTGQTKQAK